MAIQTLSLDVGVPVRAPTTTSKRREDTRAGWGLASPFLVLYVLFLAVPTAYGLVMSFFNGSLVHSGLGSFAGVDNYREALTSSDFWHSVWHTVLFTLMTTPPLVVLALILAIFTDRLKHGRWFFRLLFFAPYVIPVASV